MFKYLPHTEEDIQAMLQTIGVASVNDLFTDIPASLLNPPLDLPPTHSEIELYAHFKRLSENVKHLTPVIGAGAYDHYTPSIIRPLIERQEFLTSYTPYQPEISQGTLHYIFEFQSMITRLTGMDVANASMYDGSTATAEAMFMACAITKRDKVLVSDTLHPGVLNIIHTYAHYKGIDVVVLKTSGGALRLQDLPADLSDVAALLVQTPNIYGIIEDYDGFADALHAAKALFVINQDPATLSHLKTPGEYGADIAVGEAQTLGVPLSFGGPYIGYMATLHPHIRKLPGRICGMTVDKDGKPAFTLTLRAREQDIRRDKATSNICSNQSLLALFVTIYLSTMGKEGLYEASQMSLNGAHYLYEHLVKIPYLSDPFNQPFFKEFTLKSSLPVATLEKALEEKGFLAPFDLKRLGLEEGLISFAVTEKRTQDELDTLIDVLGGLS